MDEKGTFSSNAQIMKNIAASYFKKLFYESATNDSEFAIPRMFPELETHDLNWIKRGVSATEVKNAVFGIGSLKTPGSDGFPTIFYQKHWDLCGEEIINFVKKAFVSGTIPEGSNHTLLALVPKTASPQNMALFRPISLCNTLYKVISKCLVSRI